MTLRVVKLEPGWLDRQFKAAQEVLNCLPSALREQTPARRMSAQSAAAQAVAESTKTKGRRKPARSSERAS